MGEKHVKYPAHRGPATFTGPWAQLCSSSQVSAHKRIQGEAEAMQAEVKAVLKKAHTPQSNISREEQKAIKELKNDNTR